MVGNAALKRIETQLERARERERKAWERVEVAQQAAVRVHEDVFTLELDVARLRARDASQSAAA